MRKYDRHTKPAAIVGAALFAIAASGLAASDAKAEYPERPITVVISYGPGGATDIAGRTLTNSLSKIVPQPVLAVNRAGAGGATGAASVKNADPDGYTVMISRVGTHTVNPALKETLPYTLDDFDYYGVFEINPVACAVKADSDIKSMEDLVARIKANPKTISYSSSGVGSLLHIAGAMAVREFGVENPVEDLIHIPLKGGGAAATAVLSGTATFICTNSSALASFVSNKQLKPLMVTTKDRVEGFDAPTSVELGKPNLQKLVGWSGIAGPKGMPKEVGEKWAEWLKKATADPDFLKQMESRGSVIQLMSPEEGKQFMMDQYETFKKLVNDLNMRIKG
ncbi:MAG: Bug family tripartite tricarboxylate transporter substrate binding protein [Hyphomicrobiaceae bacterium]|jgi:tripartite-type tricarboxylate transporter receptor subunit TctC